MLSCPQRATASRSLPTTDLRSACCCTHPKYRVPYCCGCRHWASPRDTTCPLAARGIAVFVHEWRGHGSSSVRAGHDSDWGYRELLEHDLPASLRLIDKQFAPLPKTIGGHSLGGQMAACLLALRPQTAQRLWLVASGSPFWRIFPRPRRWLLPLA